MFTPPAAFVRLLSNPSRRRRIALLVATSLVLMFVWFVGRAAGNAPADAHPAEAAIQQLGKDITERLVVRDDGGGYDVWLRSNAPFDKILERARFVAANGVALRGGYRLGAISVAEHDASVTTPLKGPTPVTLYMSADMAGSLLILRGAGKAKGTQAWAPPYRPLPLELPHGPIR